jgi:hypothetical protein
MSTPNSPASARMAAPGFGAASPELVAPVTQDVPSGGGQLATPREPWAPCA